MGNIDSDTLVAIGEQGLRVDIIAGGHRLIGDEPEALGGTNTGPSPYDLLTAALGACTTMTLRMYADRKQWPLKSVVVRVTHGRMHAKDCEDCEDKEGMLDVLSREIELGGDLDEAQRQQLLAIANKCPVHRTLTGQIRIESKLR